jgi:hypothetical protein
MLPPYCNSKDNAPLPPEGRLPTESDFGTTGSHKNRAMHEVAGIIAFTVGTVNKKIGDGLGSLSIARNESGNPETAPHLE